MLNMICAHSETLALVYLAINGGFEIFIYNWQKIDMVK